MASVPVKPEAPAAALQPAPLTATIIGPGPGTGTGTGRMRHDGHRAAPPLTAHASEPAAHGLPGLRQPALGAAVIVACAALLIALASASPWLLAALEYDRGAILAGQYWRLWTGHAVHWSAPHALTDSLALAVAAAVYRRHAGNRALAGALLLGAPAISLGLLLAAPGMTHYRGASGLCVMLAVLAGAALWAGASTARRCLLVLLAAALAAKTLLETLQIPAPLAGLPPGVAVAWQAHVLGAACGVMGLLFRKEYPWPRPTSRCA
ncbi:rhombosortase [Oxalobacteraceae bacterium A2-2]